MNTIKFKIPINVAPEWREIVSYNDYESVADFVESLIIELPTSLYLLKERVDKLISQLVLNPKCKKLYINPNKRFTKRIIQELKRGNIDKKHFLIYRVYEATKETFPDYIKKINEFYFSMPSDDDKKDDQERPNITYYTLPFDDDKRDDQNPSNTTPFIPNDSSPIKSGVLLTKKQKKQEKQKK
ncbi:MAG: hypothetical protein ACTSRI_10855 [Promethearchaeota archaeon]